MCGFAGFSYKDEKILKNISKTLNARAKDYEYFHYEDRLSFYHAHLSISDLDKNTSQPLIYKEYVIGLVGEIYNKQFLLNLIGLKDNEDNFTELEVIGFCYEKLGEYFINYINGEFSIFIYNRKEDLYLLFRDRWGVNNAYYRLYNGHFFFSSEIKSLILDKAKINKDSFIEHIVFQFGISPNTIVKDIFTLRPGTYLKYKKGKIDISNLKPYIYQENNENIIEAIKNSVKRRIPKYQKNIFISLSGGPDSNLIMFFLAKYFSGNIIAYSFLTKENEEEIKYARKNTKNLGIKHIIIDMNDYSHKNNFNINAYVHEGIVDYPNILKLVKDNYPEYIDIKVEFGGDGKEELFNNNTHYPYKDILSKYNYFFSKKLIKSYNITKEFLNKNMFDYNLQLIDKVTLTNGVERRLPFTDYELLKFYGYNHLKYKPEVVKFLQNYGLEILPSEMGFNSGLKFKYLNNSKEIFEYFNSSISILNNNSKIIC